ncbi:hypothetical protein J8J40_32665, partial [Mycobacterium tuberculosis]|nr:hypothetical protein [Mycobacterium tuberculosis]
LERLDLDYAWPREKARLRAGASFAWNGQMVSASLQGVGPQALADGQTGNLSLTVTTPAARASFAGQAVVVDRLQLDGTVSL